MQSKLDLKVLEERVNQEIDDNVIPNLMKFIEIPNLSRQFDSNWATNGLLEKAAGFLCDWIKDQNIKGISVDCHKIEGKTPFVFGEVKGTHKDSPTVVFYSHIDKQPHFTGWREGLGPITPVIEDGKLYGRGANDDGYGLFSAVAIVKILQELGLEHPRCVFLFEADEESSSHDLPFWLDYFKDRIGTPDIIFGLDSGCGNYDQMWLTGSLRGNSVLVMKVKVLEEGVHSGDASGVVPDSFRIANMLIDRLENKKTGEIHADLHVQIPSTHYKNAEKVMEILGKSIQTKFPLVKTGHTMHKDPFEDYLNRTWKPTLTITGADGLPQCNKAGNVLRPETILKLAFRIPPTMDPKDSLATIKKILTENPPYDAQVTFLKESGSKGWACEEFPEWLVKSLNDGSEAFCQKPMMTWAEGGTIPFLNMIQEKFPKTFFVVTGVGGPNSNAHGPNEMLHIPFTKKLVACLTKTLYDTTIEYSKSK